MLNEKLNELIKDAMKSKDQVRVSALRSIKAAFTNYLTAKNAKPLDESAEIQIIKKLVSQRKESVDMYKTANRQDLVDQETAELNILSEFLPAEISREVLLEEIRLLAIEKNYVSSINIAIPKKEMGNFIREIKSKYPTADGKLISDIVKENLE